MDHSCSAIRLNVGDAPPGSEALEPARAITVPYLFHPEGLDLVAEPVESRQRYSLRPPDRPCSLEPGVELSRREGCPCNDRALQFDRGTSVRNSRSSVHPGAEGDFVCVDTDRRRSHNSYPELPACSSRHRS